MRSCGPPRRRRQPPRPRPPRPRPHRCRSRRLRPVEEPAAPVVAESPPEPEPLPEPEPVAPAEPPIHEAGAAGRLLAAAGELEAPRRPGARAARRAGGRPGASGALRPACGIESRPPNGVRPDRILDLDLRPRWTRGRRHPRRARPRDRARARGRAEPSASTPARTSSSTCASSRSWTPRGCASSSPRTCAPRAGDARLRHRAAAARGPDRADPRDRGRRARARLRRRRLTSRGPAARGRYRARNDHEHGRRLRRRPPSSVSPISRSASPPTSRGARSWPSAPSSARRRWSARWRPSAYQHGAKFVDVQYFDMHVKRARILDADEETLDYVPPWYGTRILELGAPARARGSGSRARPRPGCSTTSIPRRAGRDQLPFVREAGVVVNERTTNWTIVPYPTLGWAPPGPPRARPGDDALAAPVPSRSCTSAAWTRTTPWRRGASAPDLLVAAAERVTARRFDALHFEGPGTDLTVGLLPTSHFMAARFETVDGIVHMPNLPSEEIFGAPDPQRADGVVRATKPLVIGGSIIRGPRGRVPRRQGGAHRRRRGRRRAARLRGARRGRRRGWARSRSSTATGASARSTPCSSTRCSTRTPPRTSRSGESYAFTAGEEDLPPPQPLLDPRRLHDRRRRRRRHRHHRRRRATSPSCATAPGSSAHAGCDRPSGGYAFSRLERCRSG